MKKDLFYYNIIPLPLQHSWYSNPQGNESNQQFIINVTSSFYTFRLHSGSDERLESYIIYKSDVYVKCYLEYVIKGSVVRGIGLRDQVYQRMAYDYRIDIITTVWNFQNRTCILYNIQACFIRNIYD